jgi:uncharacterized protein YlxW (UPF0749 family)
MAADKSPRAGSPRTPPAPPPHATMSLLDYITSTSLDEDYAQASRQHVTEGKPRQGAVGARALVALLLFGALVATAGVQTARNAQTTASSHSSLVVQVNERKAQLASMQQRARDLRNQVRDAQTQYLQTTAESRAVDDRILRLGVASGAVPVRGPGIRIVVDDAPGGGPGKQVLDKDLQKMVNGLWLVGAEAISINGQRLSELSAIREASEGITVNYRHVNAPYVVSAIGNRNQMAARFLDTAGGQTWLALKSAVGLRFDINSEESMKLPAAPRLTLRHATTPGRGR